jgi:hypothetical protein
MSERTDFFSSGAKAKPPASRGDFFSGKVAVDDVGDSASKEPSFFDRFKKLAFNTPTEIVAERPDATPESVAAAGIGAG